MKNNLCSLGLAAMLLASGAFPATPKPAITAASLLARTKVLSSDEFEGRGPGTPGEEKTVNYLEADARVQRRRPGHADGTHQRLCRVLLAHRTTR